MSAVASLRIRKGNEQPRSNAGQYVLYWMIANRRLRYNFALDRAMEHCRALGKPLVILEALRVAYPWASDRLHQFVLDGMAENARFCQQRGVLYWAYVEPKAGDGKGLLRTLAEAACVVVTDEFPCFFLPKMLLSAAKQIGVLLEAVDSNGLLPLRATSRAFQRAFDFRRYLQRELPKYCTDFPKADPLGQMNLAAPPKLWPGKLSRWPMASAEMLGDKRLLANLAIDHAVKPVALPGGQDAARLHLNEFFKKRFQAYEEQRNEPEKDASSGLSPYLHFGHLSVHEIFAELRKREKWKPEKVALRANGSKTGWWNMSCAAESFLDELVTWRELGYNFAAHRRDYDQYASLPQWAKATLAKHARDPREYVYELEEFEAAETHDVLWNAAQRQLVREGTIHGYLRMLWGKKVLEWSRRPQQAARILIHLNNKYAMDGRNPNSYNGIFWVFGRYDRPWGPERPVFGTVRYMSSQNTARKVAVEGYIRRYAESPA